MTRFRRHVHELLARHVRGCVIGFLLLGCSTPGTPRTPPRAGRLDTGATLRDTGTTSLDTGTAPADTGVAPGDARVPLDAAPSPGMCASASDRAAVVACYGSRGESTLVEVTAVCAQLCRDEPLATWESCVDDCILTSTGAALSPGCAHCFTQGASCLRDQCALFCADRFGSDTCLNCYCGTSGGVNCDAEVSLCTGLTASVCSGTALSCP